MARTPKQEILVGYKRQVTNRARPRSRETREGADIRGEELSWSEKEATGGEGVVHGSRRELINKE